MEGRTSGPEGDPGRTAGIGRPARQQFIQNAQTKSDAYTVEGLGVVWVSEFAAHQWIDAIPASAAPKDGMLASTVATGVYFGKQYAIPYQTNAGPLFYRKDLLDAVGARAPQTWTDMQADCAKIAKLPQGAGVDCYAGQFDKYEGLTVNFSEAVQSAGGSVLGPDGKPTLNTPQTKKGLQTLVDAFRSGMIANCLRLQGGGQSQAVPGRGARLPPAVAL